MPRERIFRVISFEVPGQPKALMRARIGRRGKFARMFDPAQNKDAKSLIALFALKAMEYTGGKGTRPPMEGPLFLEATFYLVRPKSKIRKRPPDPYPFPDGRPDCDNYLKMVMDGCNGILYKDDAQIVTVIAEKRWAQDNRPRTEIRLEAEG